MIQSYPLSWPVGWPRVRYRDVARFGKANASGRHSVAECVDEIRRQLALLGASSVVISTNLALRIDGQPKSGQAQPADVGAAVYFNLRKRSPSGNLVHRLEYTNHVLAVDKWTRIEDNLWAIAKDVDAQRGRIRWGVGSVEQMFTGYTALPPAGGSNARPWWVVLDMTRIEAIDATERTISDRYRLLARKCHPDAGGSVELMAELNVARDEALKEKGPR